MAYKRISPIPIVEGGTGAQTLTTHGVLLGEGTSAITALAAAATGAALMGNTAADPSFTGSPSFSGSVTAASGLANTTGTVAINSGTSAFGLSTDSSATTISIGTGAAVKGITIGSTNSTSTTTVACGTGGANFGTSANAHATVIGSTTAASTTTIQAPSAGVILTGVQGVAVSNKNYVTINTSTGAIGSDSGPASGITTIAGDSGSASGSTITFNGVTNAGGTVKFTAAGSTVSLKVSDATANTMIGASAGASLAGGSNQNTGIGDLALTACTTGTDNTGVGLSALSFISTGVANTALGSSTGGVATANGSYNTYLGYAAGFHYTGAESSNILINNLGTVGESNTLRIGNATGTGTLQLNKAFISGINGISQTGVNKPVTINSSDQVGTGSVPAFMAYVNATQAAVTGDGTKYGVAFDVVSFDTNSNFSSNTFTAPVTGLYQFCASIELTPVNAVYTNAILYITTTALSFANQMAPTGAVQTYSTTTMSVLAHMTAGDTATVSVLYAGGAKLIGVIGLAAAGNITSYFSGYLVG